MKVAFSIGHNHMGNDFAGGAVDDQRITVHISRRNENGDAHATTGSLYIK